MLLTKAFLEHLGYTYVFKLSNLPIGQNESSCLVMYTLYDKYCKVQSAPELNSNHVRPGTKCPKKYVHLLEC